MESEETTRSPRRGLVLAGGGAKGAYAFGCLKAFHEYGICFQAVAGTSVGALNAVLWASDSLGEGQELWSTISMDKVYPSRMFKSTGLPKSIKRFLAAMYVLGHLLWATLNRIPTPNAWIWQTLCSLFVIAPIGIAFAISDDFRQQMEPLFVGPIIVYFWLTFVCLRSRREHGLRLFVSFFGTNYGVLFLAIFVDLFKSRGYSGRGIVLLCLGSTLALLVIVILGFRYLAEVVFADERSLLSSRPLAATVDRLLRERKCRIPTFVTVAKEVDVWDPDDPKWWTTDTGIHGPATRWALWYPNPEKVWLPLYVRVDRLPAEEATTYCLASAALPFGIAPSRVVHGSKYVDGGVIDNVPFVPLAEEVDELFVVLLEPFADDEAASKENRINRARWSEAFRSQEVTDYPTPTRAISGREVGVGANRANRPPKIIPLREPQHWPRIFLFYPSTSLGGFLSGTLRFESEYAMMLIHRGLEDTKAKLATAP